MSTRTHTTTSRILHQDISLPPLLRYGLMGCCWITPMLAAQQWGSFSVIPLLLTTLSILITLNTLGKKFAVVYTLISSSALIAVSWSPAVTQSTGAVDLSGLCPANAPLIHSTAIAVLLPATTALALHTKPRIHNNTHPPNIPPHAEKDHDPELHHFAAIGRTCASLIHDLATPLTVLSLHLPTPSASMHPTTKHQIDPHHTNSINVAVQQMHIYLRAARYQLLQQSITEEFDLQEIISHTCILHQSVAAEHRVSLINTVNSPLYLTSNPYRLSQALANLISNAIDAVATTSHAHRFVTISTQVDPRKNVVHISVHDTGIGFPKNQVGSDAPNNHSTKHHAHHCGLGLGIVRQIVTKELGGDVVISSTHKTGTMISISLPRTMKHSTRKIIRA